MKQHLNKEGVLNKLAMFLLFIICKEVKNTEGQSSVYNRISNIELNNETYAQ